MMPLKTEDGSIFQFHLDELLAFVQDITGEECYYYYLGSYGYAYEPKKTKSNLFDNNKFRFLFYEPYKRTIRYEVEFINTAKKRNLFRTNSLSNSTELLNKLFIIHAKVGRTANNPKLRINKEKLILLIPYLGQY